MSLQRRLRSISKIPTDQATRRPEMMVTGIDSRLGQGRAGQGKGQLSGRFVEYRPYFTHSWLDRFN